MNPFTGNVTASCPRCKQPVDDQSVPGQTLAEARRLVNKIAKYFRKQYPFAKVTTVDPVGIMTERG
jgi:hypothetical protein